MANVNKHISDDTMAILKAARKKSRDEEIALYGKPISWCRVEKSKKAYTRKKKHKKSMD